MVHKWEIHIPQLSPQLARIAYLCLPEGYGDDPERRYPVLYMFDGQNVFFDEDASFGTSWNMAHYMQESGTPLIIAAVSCNTEGDNRLKEYSPFSHGTPALGAIQGRGRTTMNWLVREFKPLIDSMARTLPGREDTLIAGSSMGGLMSLYAATAYNDVFSRAACLSPSLWVDPRKVHRMIRHAHIAPDTLIYMDYGGEEMGNHSQTLGALCATSRDLLLSGVDLTLRIVPGGTHSEASWAERVPTFMHCLGF